MKKIRLKKAHKIILAVVLVLVAIRLALPFFIVKYVNRILDENIAPYKGHIDDVDLALIRGAYRICDMKVDMVDTAGTKPFLYAPSIDLSVQWKSLFKGAIVGEIVMNQPTVNFKLAKTNSQTGAEADWVQLAKDLLPIQINRFAIDNGSVVFTYVDGKMPDFEMDFRSLNLDVTNIRNVEEKDNALPSTIVASAAAPDYKGTFDMRGEAMLLKEIPDFNYNAKFENAELVGINEVFRYFTKGMDFEQGKLSMYSEMAMKDGRYQGYFKPILIDPKIFKWKEEDRSLGDGIKEFFSEGVQEIFENHKKDQTATRVPIEGTVEGGQADIWKTITSAFVNAYIQAFQFQLDNTIDFNDLADIKNKDADKEEKKAKEEKEKKEKQEKEEREKKQEEKAKKKNKADKYSYLQPSSGSEQRPLRLVLTGTLLA